MSILEEAMRNMDEILYKFTVGSEDNKIGITAEAIDKVTGDRQKTYGHPRVNFDRIARLWEAYMTNKPSNRRYINAYDVPMFMILVKIAREQHDHNYDNLVDIIGYIKTLEMLYEFE